MNIRTILYCLLTPLCVWCISSLRIERFFKKGSSLQIIITYVIIACAMSYLLVNFLMDFFNSTIIN